MCSWCKYTVLLSSYHAELFVLVFLMNNSLASPTRSSGGPSSASSADCSSPILLGKNKQTNKRNPTEPSHLLHISVSAVAVSLDQLWLVLAKESCYNFASLYVFAFLKSQACWVKMWCLLLWTYSPEVPDIETSISATGGQDGLIVRRPLYLKNNKDWHL